MEFSSSISKAKEKNQSVLVSAARTLKVQTAEAKRKWSVRAVKAKSTPESLTKNKARWATEADFHLRERRGMSDR